MYCLELKDYYKINNILEVLFKIFIFVFFVVNYVILGVVYVNDIVRLLLGFFRIGIGDYYVFG